MSNVNIGRPIIVYDGANDDDSSKQLYVGKFHGFGQDVVDAGGQWLTIQVAIVEHPNGCLDVVAVQHCQFGGAN